MAEGGVAPQPPLKRPPRPSPDLSPGATFTDMDPAPSISSVPKIPSRPAPPIPGGRALPKPPDPGGRVPPMPPSKPPATSVPSSQPVPMRESSTRFKAEQTKIPPRPASSSGDKMAAKKRPEITIVCARPMSEVGFRDQSKDLNQSNNSSAASTSQSKPSPEVTLRKLPAVPPRTDKKQESNEREEKHTPQSSRKPPPIPQQLPSRPPPSSAIHPPPSPRPRVAARNSSSISDKKVSPSNQEEKISIRPDDTSNMEELIVPLKPVSSYSQSNSPGETNSDDVTPSVQPQFKKPLRPTIIRPQKKGPVQKLKESESSETKLVTSSGDERNIKGDNTNENVVNSERLSVSPVLRPKPVARERPKSMSIADSIKQFESKTDARAIVPKITGNKPPPLTPKPKPNILPKPSKPSITSPTESSTSSSVSSTPTSVVVSPVETSSSEQLSGPQHGQDVHKATEEVSKPITQAMKTSKRPTIIRAPSKPKRLSTNSSGDEDDKDIVKEDKKVEESSNVVEVKRRVKSTADDLLVNKNNKAPPLPNKRPVSIAGIPHGFSLPSSGKSEENSSVLNTDHPRPKPASRSNITHETPDKKGESGHKPKIIGRPPPPGIKISKDSEEMKPSRPAAPDTRPKSAVIDTELQLDNPNRPPQPQGGAPPPRPTSFDQRLVAKQGTSKPPLGRPPPPSPRERLTTPGGSEGNESKEGKPSPTLAPKRPPAVSPSKVNSRSNDRPEKPQPPRPASMRRTSLPQPLGKTSLPPDLPPRPTPGHPLYHYMAGVPHGVALHDFDGVHDGDLSFKAADRVLLVSQLDESWMRGRVDDREGIFPVEFVQVVVPLLNQSPPVGPGITTEPIAAWGDDDYDNNPQSSVKPDTIGSGPRCCARFDFEGEGENDLQFEEGDYIRLLEKIGDEWAEGEINGRTGSFPLVYVEIIEDLPLKKKEEPNQPLQRAEVSGNSPSDHFAGESKLQPSSEFPVSTVMYDFEGSDPGDLPLKAGDKVQVIGIVNDEWLYGQHQEQRGQFPANFIDPIPNNLPPFQPDVKNVSQNVIKEESLVGHESDLPLSDCTYCVALHSFSGEADDELSFSEGDRIQILENLGSDWCRGKLNDKCGIFPSNFVEKEEKNPGKINPPPDTPTEDKLPTQYGTTLYNFDAVESNELNLKVGDRILLGDFVSEAADWRWGEHDGQRGMFPVAFVEPES
ncbi:SH3 domain-containing protein 19-like isoform X2 [Pecten maximus]|uniref:SH3 domain-containing protein 19-like isoform X2 n=1 Tax=Pecten maximus TaxID=6579 RepID=UPI001458BB20|nr:SH3 domain-containing protein 19-like isoform X2 [Pecten maximus]